MPWKPLDDDIPLDHEALVPPEPVADAAAAPDPAAVPGAGPSAEADASGLTELPAGAKLDDEAPAQPAQPPAIGTGIHQPPAKGVDATPSYTVGGFSNEVSPDAIYHASLSDADKAEYAALFADPSKPPTPEFLRQWIHGKTGAYMTNADEIVARFKKDGQFNTNQKISLPTQHQGKGASYVNHAANAVAGDWGPEAAAPLDAIGLGGGDRPNIWNSDESFGNLVSQNADLERAQLDQDTADHPVASGLGEVTGAVVAAPGGGAVADAAQFGRLGELGARAAKGFTGGGIYGSGAGGPGHRLEGAAVGAAVAPVVAVGLKVPAAGYRAARSVLQGAPGQARRIIAKAIEDDANTPASMGQDMAEAHANNVPMAPADTGENVRGLLAAASRKSGLGRTIARDALETRQNELADRVVGHIQRDLGPIANPHLLAEEMMAKAHDEAGPLYDAAYAHPGAAEFSQKVEPLLQRPSMKKALAYAYRVAKEEGRDPEELGLAASSDRTTSILDANGNNITVPEVSMTKSPTWQTLDYVKRGADDLVESYKDKTTGRYNFDTEGKAANNTLRSFIGAFDVANPDYAAARAAYAGEVKGISAMNDGRKALNLTADDLEAKMRDMSPYEKQMYALGTRRAMAELVRSKGDTADVVHALVGTGKKRAMLGRLFGDRKQFQQFVDTLDQEKQGWRTYKQALGGSVTQANKADDIALEAVTTGVEMMAHGGVPVATVTRKLSQIFGRQLSEKTHQEIAALLSNTDHAALAKLAQEIARGTARRVQRAKLGKTLRVGLGNSATPIMAEQAQ